MLEISTLRLLHEIWCTELQVFPCIEFPVDAGFVCGRGPCDSCQAEGCDNNIFVFMYVVIAKDIVLTWCVFKAIQSVNFSKILLHSRSEIMVAL
jgi:hypothetical protein